MRKSPGTKLSPENKLANPPCSSGHKGPKSERENDS